jgi:hypothetical protein
MRGVAFAFFAAGSVAVLAGMVWGIQMSASHDHTLAPAHAHLNLVGWVTMGLFGLYYAQTPAAAASRLARVHVVLAVGGLVLMVPGIALAITGGGAGLAAAGSVLSLASMAVFVITVFRHGLGRAA